MSHRLDQFLEQLDRVRMADLGVLSLPEPDPDLRAEILARVAEAARFGGDTRVAEADEARRVVRETLIRRFSAISLHTSFAGVTWEAMQTRAPDRVRIVLAAEDAAVAWVLRDLLDDEDAAALREAWELATSMPGTAWTGALDARDRGPAFVATAALAAGAGAIGGIVAGIAALGRRRRPNGPEG